MAAWYDVKLYKYINRSTRGIAANIAGDATEDKVKGDIKLC